MKKEQILSFLKKYKYEISAVAITFAFSVAIFVFSSLRFPNDDQFITYRYIDNFVIDGELVYNLGERLMGFTSPLFVLVGSLFKFILPWAFTPTIISWLNIFFLSFSSLYFYRICKKFVSPNWAMFAVLIFVLDMSKTILEGMETPLFFLTVFIFLDALFDGKYYTSSVFLALTVLTRPDAGLVAILALVYWWQKTGFQKTVRLVSLCVLVALPWLIFSTIYFGTFIPQSIISKMRTSDIVIQADLQAFKVQLASISREFWGKIYDPDSIPLQSLVNLLPVILMVSIATWKKLNKDSWIIFAIPIIYFVSFSVSNPVMWPWYVSQSEPFWIMLSIFGLAVLLEKVKINWVKVIILVLIAIGPFYWWYDKTTTKDRGSKQALFTIAEYLKDNMKPSETVAVNNLGIIGFVTKAYIFDFFGILNDVSVAFYPVTDPCADKANNQYIIPSSLIMYSKPDWLVASGEGEIISCFKESRWFREHYTRMKVDGIGGGNIWKLKTGK